MYLPKAIDFAARFEYLAAMAQHRPNALADLQAHTFPVYRKCWEAFPNTTALQNFVKLSAAVRRGAGKEFIAVVDALEKWTATHEFLDLWLQDAGIQSMYGWFHGNNAGRWSYFPEELETPRFQPNFGHWIPGIGGIPDDSSWPAFKTATDKIYRSGLIDYRATVRRVWGQGKTKLPEHAAWTVRWQLGKSPEAIRNWHLNSTGKTVSLTNIQLAVHAFAESAGVTLRKPKAGRQAKKI